MILCLYFPGEEDEEGEFLYFVVLSALDGRGHSRYIWASVKNFSVFLSCIFFSCEPLLLCFRSDLANCSFQLDEMPPVHE